MLQQCSETMNFTTSPTHQLQKEKDIKSSKKQSTNKNPAFIFEAQISQQKHKLQKKK